MYLSHTQSYKVVNAVKCLSNRLWPYKKYDQSEFTLWNIISKTQTIFDIEIKVIAIENKMYKTNIRFKTLDIFFYSYSIIYNRYWLHRYLN